MWRERLLHEYSTKVKEHLFLERRVSKLSKVRGIAIYRRCYPRNLGQRVFGGSTRIPTNPTTEQLRLTHTTTIEAPKSSQQLPPQIHLKVLRRTHHREILTLLPQKSRPTRALTSSLSAPPHTFHPYLHLQRKLRHLPVSVHYVVLFRLRT
jgi:hypothetical protein